MSFSRTQKCLNMSLYKYLLGITFWNVYLSCILNHLPGLLDKWDFQALNLRFCLILNIYQNDCACSVIRVLKLAVVQITDNINRKSGLYQLYINRKSGLYQLYINRKSGLYQLYINKKSGLYQLYINRKSGLYQLYINRKSGLYQLYINRKSGLYQLKLRGNKLDINV